MFIRQYVLIFFQIVQIFTCIIFGGCESSIEDNTVYENRCELPQKLIDEIKNYGPIVNRIILETTQGKFAKTTYNELAKFVDIFGNRIAGSQNLENAIDYMLNISNVNNLENVHGEEVSVPHWIRGNESATLLQPRFLKLSMLGLGGSIATPPEGITAEVIVFTSFDEMENLSTEVKGKIVVFVPEYISYGKTVQYRSYGAVKAARFGAVATLIRSIGPFSMANPHTGWQDYDDNVTQIPTACITVEDAHMLKRMQNRGSKIVINLKMEAKTLDPVTSRNTVLEIKGSENPEKVVFVSGHLDSWDVGNGAMDDGGGVFISYNALVILKALDLRPKRTVRAILWTAEEEGLVGAEAYAQAHKNETDDWMFIMESDDGTFNPRGLEYSAGPIGSCIIEEIMKLFKSMNTTQTKKSDDIGSDIMIWIPQGIPGASLMNDNEKYFWYHHSNADSLDVEDPVSLDKSTALWASISYILADLSIDFPRN